MVTASEWNVELEQQLAVAIRTIKDCQALLNNAEQQSQRDRKDHAKITEAVLYLIPEAGGFTEAIELLKRDRERIEELRRLLADVNSQCHGGYFSQRWYGEWQDKARAGRPSIFKVFIRLAAVHSP